MEKGLIETAVMKWCSVLRIELDQKKVVSFAQFVRFCLVGVSNTVVSYGVNVLVLFILHSAALSWDYIAANIVAFIISVLWSFALNSRFVFPEKEGEERSMVRVLLKTFMSYGFTGIVLNNMLSWLWITVLGISKYIAPAINVLIGVPVNFSLNKLWAYR